MFPTCILGLFKLKPCFGSRNKVNFQAQMSIACGAMSFLTGPVGQQVTSEPLIRQLSQNQSLWAALL
jgi:hypothetical protein